ncbi:transposase [Cytobacillus firmus]|uniref:transposase n=1 Tax=Cytobacillus firmus TaxID=1399 RepID=UPI00384AAB4B
MPREARRKGSSGIYHIMLRGINKQTIFEDDEDRETFLEILKKYKDRDKYVLYSYCLMDNHIHLLLRELEEPISQSLKRISSSYVYWYNMKYDRCGHLFQERFKSEIVDHDAYFITVIRYIHQNPLKAGMGNNVFESKWTSINEYLHHGDLIDRDAALQLFSEDKSQAIRRFCEYMKQANNDQCLEDRRKVKTADCDVREYLRQLGIENNSTLQQIDKETRDAILFKLKQLEGVSLRQLSRLTGISKSVIQRAR